MSKKLRILPLGGLGEIGKNMAAVEYDGRILVVDAGLMFPTPDMPGIDLVLPDFSYLVDRADRAAVLVGDGLRRGGKGVGHGNESCLRVARYGLGMHLADASCAQKAKSDRHVSPHSG